MVSKTDPDCWLLRLNSSDRLFVRAFLKFSRMTSINCRCRLFRLRDKFRRFRKRWIRRSDRIDQTFADVVGRVCSATRRQLRLVQAHRPDEIAASGERSVAGEAAPHADRPIVRGRRSKDAHRARLALPKNTIRRRPTGARRIDPAILQIESRAVHSHVVVQHARRPTFNRPAVAERFKRVAINKRIGSSRTVPDGKVVTSVFAPATQEQRQLALGEETCGDDSRRFRRSAQVRDSLEW